MHAAKDNMMPLLHDTEIQIQIQMAQLYDTQIQIQMS